LQVKVELQADCLSGVWVNREAKKRPNFLEGRRYRLGADDGLGDRRRYACSGNPPGPRGCLTPSPTARPRKRKQWFMTGYQQARWKACNTFGAGGIVAQMSSTRRVPSRSLPLNIAGVDDFRTRGRSPMTSPARRWRTRLTAGGHRLAARAGDRDRRRRKRSARWSGDGSWTQGRRCGQSPPAATGFHRAGERDGRRRSSRCSKKRMDGFSHRLSHDESRPRSGTSTIQSRAHRRASPAPTFIFCLAGIARRLSRRLGRHSGSPSSTIARGPL